MFINFYYMHETSVIPPPPPQPFCVVGSPFIIVFNVHIFAAKKLIKLLFEMLKEFILFDLVWISDNMSIQSLFSFDKLFAIVRVLSLSLSLSHKCFFLSCSIRLLTVYLHEVRNWTVQLKRVQISVLHHRYVEKKICVTIIHLPQYMNTHALTYFTAWANQFNSFCCLYF